MCQKYTIIPELLKLNKQNEFLSIMNSRIPEKNSRFIFVKNIVVYIFIEVTLFYYFHAPVTERASTDIEKMPLTKNMKWPKSVVTIVIIFKHGLWRIIEKFGDLGNKTVGKTRIFLHFSLQKTAPNYADTHTQQTARSIKD